MDDEVETTEGTVSPEVRAYLELPADVGTDPESVRLYLFELYLNLSLNHWIRIREEEPQPPGPPPPDDHGVWVEVQAKPAIKLCPGKMPWAPPWTYDEAERDGQVELWHRWDQLQGPPGEDA